jgi:hypothetical protein
MNPNNSHLEDEELESYSMRALSLELEDRAECHLLICESCRQRLMEAEEYRVAVKDAARSLRLQQSARAERRWSFPRLIPAFAALALIGVAAVVLPLHHGAPAPFAVSLRTMRGPSNVAAAPSRRPLLLALDLTGLAASPSYRIEMVNQSGDRVWQGECSGGGPTASVAVPPQARGIYFVRVDLPSGEALREYGLGLSGDN